MAKIVMDPEALGQLLSGEIVSIQGTQVLLEADWNAIFGALAQALSLRGIQAVLAGKADWELSDRLASMDVYLPLVSRLSPEQGAALQVESVRIAKICLEKILEQVTGGREPADGELFDVGPPLDQLFAMMWIHGFSNGHDYVKDFGVMTEIDLTFVQQQIDELPGL